MLSCAIAFIAMALVATVLGFSGMAGAATNVAWILALIGLVGGIEFSLATRPIDKSLTRNRAGEPSRRDLGDGTLGRSVGTE